LIGNLVSDPFYFAKVATFSREDFLRFLKNLQQLAQSHRPNGRQHVERDTGFGRVHWSMRRLAALG
jgi:hypothetical protein